MPESKRGARFIEDELPRPFTGTMAWTDDGRGVTVCVAAQAIWIPYSTDTEDESGGKVRLVDRIIRARLARTGIKFDKIHCEHCGGWHIQRA